MLSRIFSCSIVALSGTIIEVQVDCSPSDMPQTIIVGLPDAAVQESKERVRGAIRNSNLQYPRKKVTVNLAPADIRKEGPSFDLPIAIGVLAANGDLSSDIFNDSLMIGELALDGAVRHVRGILPIVAKAKACGFKRVFVPISDAKEASLVFGIDVYSVSSLSNLVEYLRGNTKMRPETPIEASHIIPVVQTDFSEIRGQEHVKRALEIAAAGGHNALLSGPPGTGKTLLARALPSIMPKMTFDEALDVTQIYSIADALPPDVPLIQARPFRSPHHTISNAGLVGGGNPPKPGEISMAHRGVLFLDELPEFSSRVLEVMRQPLEDKVVTISRASGSVSYPANFMLVAAMNPCPCGYYGDPVRECSCSESSISKYQKRISGPLLDRIDLHVDVPRINFEKLNSAMEIESSEVVRGRVEKARAIQQERFREAESVACNGEMHPGEIRAFCQLDAAGVALMKNVMERFSISARGYHRVLRLARTIADLDGQPRILSNHLAEAIQYRARSQR